MSETLYRNVTFKQLSSFWETYIFVLSLENFFDDRGWITNRSRIDHEYIQIHWISIEIQFVWKVFLQIIPLDLSPTSSCVSIHRLETDPFLTPKKFQSHGWIVNWETADETQPEKFLNQTTLPNILFILSLTNCLMRRMMPHTNTASATDNPKRRLSWEILSIENNSKRFMPTPQKRLTWYRRNLFCKSWDRNVSMTPPRLGYVCTFLNSHNL